MIMRKLTVFTILSVMILSVAGCSEVATIETTDSSKESITTTTSVQEDTDNIVVESSSEEETDTSEIITEAETNESEISKETEASETREQEAKPTNAPVKPTEEASIPEPTTQTPEPTTKPTPEPEPTEAPVVQAVAYNPNDVVNKAIAKCKAGGMILSTDAMNTALAEGRITQDEYNEFYPLDGLGYYSVFVETDLNRASTTSGRGLGSVDGIADYIAGMMLLETEPEFNIQCVGTYNLSGTEYYEFRCYR